jgi:hypothetical protein
MAICTAGYVWFGLNQYSTFVSKNSEIGVCLFKHVTNIPCPSCGSTRSLAALLSGDFLGSLLLNPLGLILAVVMLVLPLWVLFDVLSRKETFLKFYISAESVLKQKQIAIPAILLVVSNWIWNIYKGI